MITVYNSPKGVEEKFVKKTINNVLQGERRELKGISRNLAVVFLEEKEIQKLNLCYRKKNLPTDVLSFTLLEFRQQPVNIPRFEGGSRLPALTPLETTKSKTKRKDGKEILEQRESLTGLANRYTTHRPWILTGFAAEDKEYLGEVLVCEKQIRENAKTAGERFKRELARVLIHGTLHLLGYEHEKGAGAARIMFEKQEDYLSQIL